MRAIVRPSLMVQPQCPRLNAKRLLTNFKPGTATAECLKDSDNTALKSSSAGVGVLNIGQGLFYVVPDIIHIFQANGKPDQAF